MKGKDKECKLKKKQGCDECFEFYDECPGWCYICGEAWEFVRPGKSQEICGCQEYIEFIEDALEATNDSKPECVWKLNDNPEELYYGTTCGEEVVTIEDIPLSEIGYNFCYKCGGKIRLA